LAFQEEVIVRRTRYDLKKARERAHLLEGLLIAQDNIDEVIHIIRTSYDDAKENLMARFDLDEVQAQAILDMRLKALQGLDREKLENEYKELEEKIAYYESVLSDDSLVRSILKEELTAIADKYGDDRRTEIMDVEDEIDIEDLIEEEDCVYTLTHNGYIKRTAATEYTAQRRGGKGVRAMTTREEDYVETLFTASTHDYILFFTSFGRVYRKKGYLIPEAGRTAKGTNIINIIPIQTGEKVTAMIRMPEVSDGIYLVMITRKGTVKRLEMSALKNIRSVGIRAISLDEDDELISVRDTDGEQKILIATHDGMALCFSEGDVRPMGRNAAGVIGIRLREGDYCIGAARAREGGALLTVTENGFGKRTDIDEYLSSRGESGVKVTQKRGGLGMKNYTITEKTGKVAAVKVVDDNDDVLIISDDGTMIRMASTDISTYKRDTMGVRLMRVSDNARVISIARMDREDEEEESPDIH
ncbi:MAG: DNA gyrase subunit A, partial [Clostridiales bacterium]|nr:DNA gyrase subunit A [Clostridiales bacterium]